MTLLAIDSSSSQGSIAIISDGTVVINETYTAGRGEDAALLFETLGRIAKEIPTIDKVVVGLGPGSYSGIRIAIATATGFCLAGGYPLVGLPSVCGIETSNTHGEFHVVGDARRNTFYHAHLSEQHCIHGPQLLSRDALASLLASTPGIPALATSPLTAFPDIPTVSPSAPTLARAALARPDQLVDGTNGLEPLYLREASITPPKPRAQ